MSEEPEFFSYTREEFLDEFVHPDDRPAVEEAHQKRVLAVRAEYLAEMRKRAGLTQAEVAEAMGVSQQRVSAIENGSVAELSTLADYIRALGGELKVIADFGDTWCPFRMNPASSGSSLRPSLRWPRYLASFSGHGVLLSGRVLWGRAYLSWCCSVSGSIFRAENVKVR